MKKLIAVGGVFGSIFIMMLGIAIWTDTEPKAVSITDVINDYPIKDEDVRTGYVTADVMVRSLDTLLNKNGGYTRNDILPPFVFLDNMPSYEMGYLKILREVSGVLRDKTSKVEFEDKNLAIAQPAIGYSANDWGWWFMSNTEDQYEIALKHFKLYRDSLVDDNPREGQFVPRSNDLALITDKIAEQLYSQVKVLKSSTGVEIVNQDKNADSAKVQKDSYIQKAPFMEIDDNFFEARGASAASLNVMMAMNVDFKNVLKDKNAENEFNQAISWLRLAYDEYHWFMVLPGGHYGGLGNHSGDLAADLSSAIINLRRVSDLLRDG